MIAPSYPLGSTYSQRPETVRKLFELIKARRVVHVRSTPTSGKTVLAGLLFKYIESKHRDFNPIFITWRLYGTADRGNASWMNFLCKFSGGLVKQKTFYDSKDVIFIIDEAQLSYKDKPFWVDCLKSWKDYISSREDEKSGPYFVLFSSFGSPSSITLEIDGSSPVDLAHNQRVSLLPATDGVPGLGVCFTFEEVKDVCSALIAHRNFTVHEDVLKYLFELANGHAGLTRGLLNSLFEREVSIYIWQFIVI
jgi:hypothetical protein